MIAPMLMIFHRVTEWLKNDDNINKTMSGKDIKLPNSVTCLNDLTYMDNTSTIDLIDNDDLSDFFSGTTESMIVFSDCNKPIPVGSIFLNDANNNCTICASSSSYSAANKVGGKMSAEVGRVPGSTPTEADCNSNNLAIDVSLCSSVSADFVHDNSDYQWFVEYGYRDQATNGHPSVLSLTSSHEVGYYDELARNLDANVAEVEMEDFHSRDIHSILSTLQNDLQGMEEREMFASVSGSMMVKFDFDSSLSPHSSSQEGNMSMSVCKSEPLFSPLRQPYLPAGNLSVDSLDLSDDINILVTCQANKNNYTIAFEGSTVMGSESDILDNAPDQQGVQQRGTNTMVRSDSMYTTWSQLKQQSRGSENGNSDDTGKSLSMPDLCTQPQRQCMAMAMSMSSKLSSEACSSEQSSSDPRTIKLYDIRKSTTSDSSSSATDKGSRPRNFSLVKLFMKQKGGSSDGMEQSSASECWGESRTINRETVSDCEHHSIPQHKQTNTGTAGSTTSVYAEANPEPSKPCRNINNNNSYVATVDKACQTDGKHPVYIVFPNYTLPNLEFIKENQHVGNIDWSQMFLRGQKMAPPARRRPVSLNDIEGMRKKGFQHVQDWPSLTFLLPKECKEFLDGIPEIVAQLKDVKKPLYNITSASSGYRGSSTMLTSNTSDETQPRGILRDPSSRFTCKTAKDTANMRRLEELMEISSVFGDSSDSVSETEMKKLRAHVSRFLSMQKELERVSERLVAKDVMLDSSEALKKTVSFTGRGATPPNSPAVSQAHKTYQERHANGGKRLVEVPICEEAATESAITHGNLTPCLAQKKDLVQDVQRSIEKVLRQSAKNKDSDQLAQVCLQYLCPSLYAILNDGLRDALTTPFGPIPNSVWAVVEASAQQGPMTSALHELVQRLNREFVLTEPLLKVNAFFFGLLNVQALDGWLSYLRTQEGLLHKHYETRGIFVLANALGSVRSVLDKLVEVVHPLSKISFELDLFHQAKILHRSLSNINSLLEATSSDGLLSPSKQLMLLKLVQSIQNSAKEGSESSSKGEVHHTSPAERRSGSKANKPRPRSGCDIPSGKDVASVMKKRWSGVQLNSKLSRAFEQLGEEVESEYTDSLDGPHKHPSPHRRLQISADTSQDLTSTWTRDSMTEVTAKDHKKLILSSLNRKGAPQPPAGGHKFKRLQQRWEQLSGRTDSSVSPLSSPEHRPHETEKPCDITTPSPTTRQSRIPRLVTSPVRPGTAPFAICSPRSQGAPRKQASPTAPPTRVRPGSCRPTTTPNRPAQSVPRPTSLPYSTLPARKLVPHPQPKTAAMSLNRRGASHLQGVPRIVRTLTHRLPSDSGHLSFNEGEKLRVVLEVDDTYLLCCSGSQKGLVPKNFVIAVP